MNKGGFLGGIPWLPVAALLFALSATCSEATEQWKSTYTGPPTPGQGHTVVWTGARMIVWGGSNGSACLRSGGRYKP